MPTKSVGGYAPPADFRSRWLAWRMVHAALARHSVLNGSGIGNSFGGIQDFQAHDVAVLVVVEDHPGLILVAFLDGRIARQLS
jgi:hypothetical protein